MTAQTIQVRLSLDEGLKKTWDLLSNEYEALDKASIIRLALNTLAKKVKEAMRRPLSEKELFEYLNESGEMSEEEAIQWWNKNKSSL